MCNKKSCTQVFELLLDIKVSQLRAVDAYFQWDAVHVGKTDVDSSHSQTFHIFYRHFFLYRYEAGGKKCPSCRAAGG
jgi:hypothetical protein